MTTGHWDHLDNLVFGIQIDLSNTITNHYSKVCETKNNQSFHINLQKMQKLFICDL